MTTTATARPGQGGPQLYQVLFLCMGNACRSQMAEGFARVYGSDVMTAMSAGLTPAVAVPDETIQTMDEKNIDIRRQFPKSWRHLAGIHFDLIVNLSGNDVPAGLEAPVRTWKVPDPYLYEYPHYCKTRDQIENLVMGLILELRRAQSRKAAR